MSDDERFSISEVEEMVSAMPDFSDEEHSPSANLFDIHEREILTDQEKDWFTAPNDLLDDHSINLDSWGSEYLRIPEQRLVEMDAYSKCWKTTEPSSPSLLLNETDGGVWAFCQGCVANIPRELQEIMYFFHMLQCHINNMYHYVVPSKNVTLRRDRQNSKVVSDIIWHKPSSDVEVLRRSNGRGLNFTEIMCERAKSGRGRKEFTVKVAPFKIHMGFTGAVYEYDGKQYRKTVAVLFVTWCRNFDLTGFITDQFLRDKKEDLKKMDHITQQLKHIWKKIARIVAFENLGIDESVVGMPENYSDQPGGVLGCDTLFNMFQIPLQIYGIIQKELRERVRNMDASADLSDVYPSNLKIIGMPNMTFEQGNQEFEEFVGYMQKVIDNYSNERAGLAQNIKTFYKKKEKSEDEQAEQECTTFDLHFWGGWPLDRRGGKYCKFGLPPLPLYLTFTPEHRMDHYTSFDTWLASMGGPNGIPKLANTVMRAFLVQDLSSPAEAIFATLEHFLQDHRVANPSLVLQEYYGERADPLSGIITAGYLRSWWNGLQKDIQTQRAAGLDLSQAISSFNRYIVSSKKHHWSSIISGSFRSNRIIQTLGIVEKLDLAQVGRGEGEKSIATFMGHLCRCMSNERSFDPYQRASEGFWKCFELLNRSYTMNSSNLEGLVEIMESQLLWMFGPHNETWPAYFQGIQFVSGNGHFKLTTKEGTWMDVRKPNSTGMDWTIGRLYDLFQSLLDEVGMMDPKQNMQAPLNCMGWTPASIPNITSAVVTEGQITSLPDPSLGLRSIVATEIRGDSLKALIQGAIPRDADGQDKTMFNTSDPNKTGERKVQEKKRITDYMLSAASTNVAIQSDQQREEWKTLLAVMHVMNPGAAPFHKKRRVGAFNEVVCHAFGGRQKKPEQQDQIAYFLPFTHVWASVVALMNKSGVMPMEISPSALALLDWLFLYIKEHLSGALEQNVEESFKRMKDGYEARQVSKSLWTQTIMHMPYAASQEDLTIRLLHGMYSNAVPLGDAVGAAYSFLTRGLHMGCLLMISCIAKHLEVPIINLDTMCELLECQQVPASGTVFEAGVAIRDFMIKCATEHRMCPESFYITSDGTITGDPRCEKSSMLRVKKNKLDEVTSLVAKKIKQLFGRQLTETCHCGPEESIYKNALNSLMVEFTPDFRKLFSNKLYKAQSLVNKLGLQQMIRAEDWPDDSDYSPPIAKIFSVGGPAEETPNQCLGVHPFLLIFYVSIAGGATLHPKVSSDWAKSILSKILSMAPKSATPGNLCLVRSFDLNTTVHQRVVISSTKPRCHHFARPTDDFNFVNTGVCTYARAMRQFMPEDCMHCGPLFRFAELFKCDVMELPGRDLYVMYELMANTYYSIYRASDGAYGTLFVEAQRKRVSVKQISPVEEQQEWEWGYDEWHENLRDEDFIITPMLWRSGVAVRLEHGVGCLTECQEYASQFNPEDCSYSCVYSEEGDLASLHFSLAFEALIQVGTQLYLKLDSPSAAQVMDKVRAQDRDKPLLAVRLNVPTTQFPEKNKLYVTCLRRAVLARSDMADVGSLTIAVDPWELLAEPGAGQAFVPWLTNRPGAG